MKLGVIHGTVDFQDHRVLERTAELGLAGFEPYLDSVDSPYLAWSEQQAADFVEKARALKIELPSVAVGIFNNDSALIEREKQDQAIALVRRCLNLTATLGANMMLLCTYIRSHPDTPEKKRCLLDVLRKVESVIRQTGVAIALESPLPAEELLDLVQGAESEHVGVYYDLGNAVALGFDPVREIPLLGRRIRSVHVKDSADRLGGLHLGQGQVDFGESLHALRRTGYDGWLILETPADDVALVRRDVETLRRYLKPESLLAEIP